MVSKYWYSVLAVLLAIIVVVSNPPLVHATAIDIGAGATDRASMMDLGTYTIIDKTNPANDTGTITSFELWYNTNATGVKIGTFSGSGTSYTNRDYETIGSVTSGSKQTFSGLNCDVVTGDVIGIHQTGGNIENDTSGGSGLYLKDGDQFGAGTQTFGYWVDYPLSIYGIGATPPVPTVTTQAASSVEATTATGNGNVSDNGSATLTERGIAVCLESHGTPDTGDALNIHDHINAIGAFTELIISLTEGTAYHFRAYAINSAGTGYGAVVDVLTKPTAPANVLATDGTDTAKVIITWDDSVGATDYQVYRDGAALGWAGDVNTFDDNGADAPTITEGTASAEDGGSGIHVTLSIAGESANYGTHHSYKVRAKNATGESADSATNDGWRDVGALTYQWQRSAGDAPGGYGNIGGGTTDPYDDLGGVVAPDGRYYVCVLDATGAVQKTTNADRGYMAAWVAPTVVTGICSGFTTTSATINGMVTANGDAVPTQYGFEYGLTIACGTPVMVTGTPALNANFFTNLIGLTPATVYYYRARVDNGASGYGSVQTFSTQGSATIYENLTSGCGVSDNATAGFWDYQTFTDNTTGTYDAHTVTSIWLYLKKVGTPLGDVTVSLRHTSAGVPTGTDLLDTSGAAATKTFPANSLSTSYSWYEFVFNPPIELEANTQYAIVLRVIDGDSTNYVVWCWVPAGGGFVGGNAGYSSNSGMVWVSSSPAVRMFQIWGYPCLVIEDAKVFTDYEATGDWLIVIRYKNIYPPYYEAAANVKNYFVLQLADAPLGGTVKGQVACPAWDYQPGSIYLAASQVTSLTYGGTYYVRLYGTFTGNPVASYALKSSDWLGSDLTQLDSWVISSAKLLADYYNTVMTTYVADRGEVLNATGGVIFANGITALTTVRPNLFQIVSTPTPASSPNFPQAGEGALTWQSMMGPYVTASLTSMGNVFGVDGKAFGAWILISVMLCLMVFGLPAGHTAPANILAIPIFLMGLGLRLFDWVTGAVMLSLMAFLLVYNLWINKSG